MSGAQQLPWRPAQWSPDSLGNHRVVVQVPLGGGGARPHSLAPPRRSSPRRSRSSPSAPGGTRIANLYRRSITRESGDLAFQPVDGAGDYYLYYLPYRGSITSNYPRIFYPAPASPPTPPGSRPRESRWAALPGATVVAMESIDEFNSFSPMQVIATGPRPRHW